MTLAVSAEDENCQLDAPALITSLSYLPTSFMPSVSMPTRCGIAKGGGSTWLSQEQSLL
jgi:hypothetical protein